MQNLSQTCLVAEHRSTATKYICIYPRCQLSRFFCSKCLFGTLHQHNQKDNSHLVKDKDFQDKIKKSLIQAKGQQKDGNINIQKSVVPLKQIIQEMQNLLNHFQNIIYQVEQDSLQNVNMNHLENQFLNFQNHEFDEETLNHLINFYLWQQDVDIQKKLEEQSNLIIQNALKIKDWSSTLIVDNQISLSEQIQVEKYQIQQTDDTYDQGIYSGAISNDLQFIISGGFDELIKIWDYQTNNQIQQIKLNDSVWSCKFTEDSTLLYAGTNKYIYQFDVKNQFKELYKSEIHQGLIFNIYCISNTIILTSSWDKAIIKTDVNKKQQLLKIQAHTNYICGLDYNKKINVIASGSGDKQIKLWNGNDGSLILQKLNAHNNNRVIEQVLFIINNNQLISLDDQCNLMIWNVNYQTKQLEQHQLIENSGYNVSLVLQQEYIIATGRKVIKVYSIQGQFIRQFDHEVENYCQEYFYDLVCFNTIQLDSMKAVLIKGSYKLQVCKVNLN